MKSRFLLPPIAAACFCTAAAAADSPATSPGEKMKEGQVPWREMLYSYGKAFSLSFSIERDETNNGPGKMSPLETLWVKLPDHEVKNSAEFLAMLRQWLPNTEVRTDEVVPGVVHIIEQSAIKNDILGNKLSIKFSGTSAGLWKQLTKRSNGLVGETNTFTTTELLIDRDNKLVEVDANDWTYRRILSAALPPAQDRQILWEAFTTKKNGEVVAFVTFVFSRGFEPMAVKVAKPATRPE